MGLPDHPTLRVGSILRGEYRICGMLRHASTGIVFRVEQLSTGAFRALKVLSPDLIDDEASRLRFERESRLSAAIASEHVEQVLDAGVDPDTGTPWIALELLQGETLAEHVKKNGPLDLPTAALVVREICHALAAAHAVGIVHRDLNPNNILLAKPRRAGTPFLVKILDFGLAKLLETGTAGTATMVGGNPLWVAPEQLAGGPIVTAAVDIWSLGAVAFYMIAGVTFWRGGARAKLPDIYEQVVHAEIPPASIRAAELGIPQRVPAPMDAFFDRCLRRDTTERHPDPGFAFESFQAAVTLSAEDDADRTEIMVRSARPPSVRPAAAVSEPVRAPVKEEGTPTLPRPSVSASLRPSKDGPRKVFVRRTAVVAVGVIVAACLVVNGVLIVDRLKPGSRGARRVDAREIERAAAPMPASRSRLPTDLSPEGDGGVALDAELDAAATPRASALGVVTTGPRGVLSVVCVPACDDVKLDGKSLGESPIFRRSVVAGEHALRLRWADPVARREMHVRVAAGVEPTLVRQTSPNGAPAEAPASGSAPDAPATSPAPTGDGASSALTE